MLCFKIRTLHLISVQLNECQFIYFNYVTQTDTQSISIELNLYRAMFQLTCSIILIMCTFCVYVCVCASWTGVFRCFMRPNSSAKSSTPASVSCSWNQKVPFTHSHILRVCTESEKNTMLLCEYYCASQIPFIRGRSARRICLTTSFSVPYAGVVAVCLCARVVSLRERPFWAVSAAAVVAMLLRPRWKRRIDNDANTTHNDGMHTCTHNAQTKTHVRPFCSLFTVNGTEHTATQTHRQLGRTHTT